MKKYKVLLGDPEERFVLALMNYINHDRRFPILAMAFTNFIDMKTYVTAHKADLIVISRAWKPEWLSQAGEMQLPLLWIMEGDFEPEENGEEPSISRYRTGSEYVRSMMELLRMQYPLFGSGADCSCIAVYSPIGRCGKTRLSSTLCLGCTDPVAEGVGFYLGMEEYGDPDMEYHNMEELLYYVKQKSSNLSMKIKALAQREQGYDRMTSPLSYQELWELQKPDIAFLLNTVRKEGYYSLVVADIGTGSLLRPEILTEFDGTYLLLLQSKRLEGKLQAFCQMLKNQGLWPVLSEYCYPLYLEDREIMPEEGRALEQLRRNGKLLSLDRFLEASEAERRQVSLEGYLQGN